MSKTITLSTTALEDMLAKAAEAGANRALQAQISAPVTLDETPALPANRCVPCAAADLKRYITVPHRCVADAPAAPPVTAPADEAPVLYRNAKAKASGKAQADAIYAAYRAKTGKGFKAMTAAQQKACKAEIAAVWKALPGTRKTPVA